MAMPMNPGHGRLKTAVPECQIIWSESKRSVSERSK